MFKVSVGDQRQRGLFQTIPNAVERNRKLSVDAVCPLMAIGLGLTRQLKEFNKSMLIGRSIASFTLGGLQG